MNNEIIKVTQLPIIVEQLHEVKSEVTAKVEQALSLVCTEDTIKDVKKARSDLNKELKDYEERRKAVKTAIMKPYNDFEEIYKDCISETYKKADAELKNKIDSVENELKAQKTAEVKAYFDEYLQSKGIDFVTFESTHINVTLSASMKSLREQAKAFVDKIVDDIILLRLNTKEHKDEIFYEYKQSLNVSNAVTTVANRYKAIEEVKAREEERKAREQAEAEAAAKVEKVVEAVAPPTVEPIAPPVEEEKTYTLKFTVRGTMPQLKAIKEFLNNGGYDYE